ncbi:hypothetical protein [Flavobacterium sp.]|jgi:hypothetical protein|uniref:hypothetical protein n=1 Tax=Flavobacterium sp. TaxID=239 RepID=UPI00286F73F3|nr:hypothetical protein [Flavobacterium sp.]
MFEEIKIKIFGIQPAAKVTTNKLEVLIAREFPEHIEEVTLALYKLNGYSSDGINRISAAILKLADKDLSLLNFYIDKANSDNRDVLSQAEYPRCSQLGFEDFNITNIKSIYLDDWREYSKWLNY